MNEVKQDISDAEVSYLISDVDFNNDISTGFDCDEVPKKLGEFVTIECAFLMFQDC